MGTSPCFAAISTRRKTIDDFLSASSDDSALLKRGLLLKERICFPTSKIFPLRVDTQRREAKNENGTVASSENVPI